MKKSANTNNGVEENGTDAEIGAGMSGMGQNDTRIVTFCIK